VKTLKNDREEMPAPTPADAGTYFPRIWVPESREPGSATTVVDRIGWCRCAHGYEAAQALAMNEGYRWRKKLFSEGTSSVREALAGSLGQPAPAELLGWWTA